MREEQSKMCLCLVVFIEVNMVHAEHTEHGTYKGHTDAFVRVVLRTLILEEGTLEQHGAALTYTPCTHADKLHTQQGMSTVTSAS